MYKLKTKSGAKKRFKVTASGKIKFKHAKKGHNMRKLSQNTIRNLRAGGIMSESDAKIVRNFLPYC